MPNKITTVREFEDCKQTLGITVIHFWAEWNAYDVILSRILNELEDEFELKVNFCSLDIDQEHLFEFLRTLPIINVPTLAYFKNGNKISLEIGLRKKEELREKIENLLGTEE